MMRGPAPGWWMLPGAVLGVALWVAAGWAVWAVVIEEMWW